MPAPIQGPTTLYDKLYDVHLINKDDKDQAIIYIDRHLVHEVTSPQAFEGLKVANRAVRRPDCTLCTVDHNIPTSSRAALNSIQTFIKEKDSLTQVATLEQNVVDFGLTYYGMKDKRQGIVHIIGPEQGFTLPGVSLVCGDSHTSTHGAFGSLAFGIGTSEVEHVLATQTLIQSKAKNMKVQVDGKLAEGVTAKDIILHIIGVIGTAGATGCALEYCGSAIRDLSMEGRMSICNMSVEAGARCGMVSPDDITYEYVKGRPMAPKGDDWERALSFWRTLKSDEGAKWDIEVYIDAKDIAPTVSWGTSPQDVISITGTVPDPEKESDPSKAAGMRRSVEYMGLEPNTPIESYKIDKVFIGSCTNARIEDLRSAAKIAYGRKVADGVYAMVVPGSGIVKEQAEAEGLDIVFKNAGFDWREAGCSMCLGMNEDKLKPEERCASTSNRNFEGRQGPRGRTHLMSPAMAAAAAVTGHLTDVRKLTGDVSAGSKKLEIQETDTKQFLNAENSVADAAAETAESEKERADEAQNKNGGGAAAEEAGCDGAGMEKFTVLKGVGSPLTGEDGVLMSNVDTDKIIEARFLKTVKRTGLGVALFSKMRYDNDGNLIESFILNQRPNTVVLLASDNFGCGSSREHAPWALKDFGIRCVIAPSFGDIFYNNCFKNGMLPIRLPIENINALRKEVEAGNDIEVNLEDQTVKSGSVTEKFEVEPFRKYCLLNGLDDIGLTLQKVKLIDAYELSRSEKFPWLDGDRRSTGPVKIGEAKRQKMDW